MAFENRLELIKKIQQIRGSKVLCFLTTIRPGVNGSISDDCVRVFFDHLSKIPKQTNKIEKLDLFLCSNGGSGTVPWRLVPLFREYAASFNVLVPYRAYSAATLLALGADEIVMHPFGEMGPIDPTVQNDFNPTDPNTNQRIGISVEDVKAYVNFIKSTVGITHEDELVQAISVLAQKVHPLALGNVDRFLAQSRMIAAKILRSRNQPLEQHRIDEIVENMASKLYFHGHPINRKEARDELGLNVIDAPSNLEEAMWQLYLDFEREFKNTEIFNPLPRLLEVQAQKNHPEQLAQIAQSLGNLIDQLAQTGAAAQPLLVPDLVQQAMQLAGQAQQTAAQVAGFIGQITSMLQDDQPQQAAALVQQNAEIAQQVMALAQRIAQEHQFSKRVQDAANMIQLLHQLLHITQIVSPPETLEELLIVAIEGDRMSSKFTSKIRFRLYPASQTQPNVPPQTGQQSIHQEPVSQTWSHLSVPEAQT